MVYLANPEFGVNFASFDFVKFAESAGARGVHIEDPARCGEQMREALATDGPVIIECVVDPHEPPIPAKVKSNQMKSLVSALREGTPNRNRIALQMVKDMLDESSFEASPGHVIPGRVVLGCGQAEGPRRLRPSGVARNDLLGPAPHEAENTARRHVKGVDMAHQPARSNAARSAGDDYESAWQLAKPEDGGHWYEAVLRVIRRANRRVSQAFGFAPEAYCWECRPGYDLEPLAPFRDKRQLAEAIGQLMANLGATAGEVAETLSPFARVAAGPSESGGPLVPFLTAIIGSDPSVRTVAVTTDSVTVVIDRWTADRVRVPFPAPVRAFVLAFDAGCYPAL